MILLTLITAAVKTKCTTIHGNCMAFEYLLVATATFFLISAVDFFFCDNQTAECFFVASL